MTSLNIGYSDMSDYMASVDPGLLGNTVNKLETLEVPFTRLTQQQVVAIFTTVTEESLEAPPVDTISSIS